MKTSSNLTKESIYTCEFCKRLFNNKSNLKTHMQTAKYCLDIQKKSNVGVTCEYCNYTFTLKGALQNHIPRCPKFTEMKLKEEREEYEKRLILKNEKIKNLKNTIKEQEKKIIEYQILYKKEKIDNS